MMRFIIVAVALSAACSKSDKKAVDKTPPPVTPPVVAPPVTPPVAPPVTPPAAGGYALVTPDKLTWSPLMPGQPGPEIAAVHGNPMEGGASFFLRIPAKGDAGLHSHTAGYRAVLVSGKHKHWIPGEQGAAGMNAGSYWSQPGGQAHGDTCEGPDPCVLFVTSDGKFDFTPTPDVKTVEPGAYKVVKAEDMKFGFMDPKQTTGVKFAMVDGDPSKGPLAFGIESAAPFDAGLHHHTSDYHAVVLGGTAAHWVDGAAGKDQRLVPGSYWFQPGKQVHGDACLEGTCRLFLMMPGALDFIPK